MVFEFHMLSTPDSTTERFFEYLVLLGLILNASTFFFFFSESKQRNQVAEVAPCGFIWK